MHDASSLLTPWANFYVILGSSAAALTGLTFVVITLVASDAVQTPSDEGVSTFTSPTVGHFCAALFAALAVSAPWPSPTPLAIVIALTGSGGIVYVSVIMVRAARLADYRPGIDDWCWYIGAPFVAYVAMLGAGIGLAASPSAALFVLGAAALMLVFIGIHNAWDVVTWLVLHARGADDAPKPTPADGE